MNSVTLSIDFDGDELHTWPTDQLWGYAWRRRDDVSDEHHPEIDSWAWPTDQLWGDAGRRRDDVSDEHHPEIDSWAGGSL